MYQHVGGLSEATSQCGHWTNLSADNMARKRAASPSGASTPAKKSKTSTPRVKQESTEATLFIHKADAVAKNPPGVRVVEVNLYSSPRELAGYLFLESTELLLDLFGSLEQDPTVQAFLNACENGFQVKGWTAASRWQLDMI